MEFKDESRYPLQRYLEFVSTNTRNVFGIHIRAMTSSFMIISVCSIWCCNVYWSVPVFTWRGCQSAWRGIPTNHTPEITWYDQWSGTPTPLPEFCWRTEIWVRTSLRQTVKPRPSLAVVLTPGFTSISDCLWIVEWPVMTSYYTHTKEERQRNIGSLGNVVFCVLITGLVFCEILLDLRVTKLCSKPVGILTSSRRWHACFEGLLYNH